MIGRRAALAGGAALLGAAGAEDAPRGQVTWYESSTPEELDRIAAAFTRGHPGIRVQPVRLPGGNALTTRIVQESGRTTADLASGGAGHLTSLAARDLVLPVDWAARGAPAGLAGPLAVRTSASLYAVLWNTDKVADAEAPHRWEDLADPRWRGRIGSWSVLAGFAQLAAVWGEARVTALLRRFLDNRPALTSSTFQLASMVGTGEIDVAFGIHHTALPAQRAGAPIRTRFLDPTPVNSIYSFVPRRAGNPAGGIALGAWLASPEGAAAYEAATGRGNPGLPGSGIGALLGPVALAEYPLDQTTTYQAVSERLQALVPPN